MPIYQNLGVQTGKSKTDDVAYTIQEVLIKLLCSLAQHRYPLKKVHEANEGVVLIAEIPSSLKTWGGEIIISLEEKTAKTRVSVAARIKGQLYDWGKSKVTIKALFSDVETIVLDFE